MDSSIKNNEDLLMNYYLFKESKKSVFEDVSKYQYIVRQGSASRSVSKNSIFDPIKVKEIIYNDASDDFKLEAKKALISTCLNTYNSICISKTIDKEYKDSVYNKLMELKSEFYLLATKQKLLAKILGLSKILHKVIYKIYSKHFQKRQYE